MKMIHNIIKRTNHRLWLHHLLAVFFICLVVLLFVPIVLQMLWANQVYPGVRVANIELGGMSLVEARAALQAAKDRIDVEGYEFSLGKDRVVVFPLVTSPGDPDLTYNLVNYDIDKMFYEVASSGRQDDAFGRWLGVYESLLTQKNVPVHYDFNEQALIGVLQTNFGGYETPPRDAGFLYEQGILRVVADRPGQVIDYGAAVNDLTVQLDNFSNQPVHLSLVSAEPDIEYKSAASLHSQALEFIEKSPVLLTGKYSSKLNTIDWSEYVDRQELASWLVPVNGDTGVILGFGIKLSDYLESISSEIGHKPQDAKFEIDSGRIAQFQASRPGIEVDIESSREAIIEALLSENKKEAALVFAVEPPKITTQEVNDLGINEILGIGHSDFSGSPKNRRINIQVASDKLNGILISPGEEFSLVEKLKPFTQESGYLPELVIKGNRLIPEVGGGACQIGTTVFRTALDSGLDITQRRNHSFAVSYYNDENGLPGTDATIYDPAPDFRFINDTPGHILIQTHVGDDDILTYEFWGTNDGRQASTSVPVILSRSPAPDTKYIETEDLESGVTECSGYNVPGYNTTFKYGIVSSNGEYQEEYFNSKYRPWQRVCLIGVEKQEDEVNAAGQNQN